MMNKEKFESDVKEYLAKNLPSEILADENQKYLVFKCSYIVLLAKTYYTEETAETKFTDYLGELIDDPKLREPLIAKIKSLKS